MPDRKPAGSESRGFISLNEEADDDDDDEDDWCCDVPTSPLSPYGNRNDEFRMNKIGNRLKSVEALMKYGIRNFALLPLPGGVWYTR